jgi:hypothetical protein
MKDRTALRRVLAASLPTQRGGIAVDIGSGFGEIVGWLVDAGFSTYGCEVDPWKAAQAQSDHPTAIIDCADLRNWKPPSSPLVLTCIEVIEHLPRGAQRELLHLVRQWISDDGTLILSTPQRTSLVSLVDRIYCRIKGQTYHWWDPTHVSILSRRVLQRDLTNAGFSVINRAGVGLVPDLVSSHLGPLGRLVKDNEHRGILGALAFDIIYVCKPRPRTSTPPWGT